MSFIVPKISDETKKILCVAVDRGDTVSDLEIAGLPVRTVNILASYNINTLEDLLNHTQDELAKIPSIGEGAIKQIFQALSNYSKVESSKKKLLDTSLLTLRRKRK